MSWVTSTTVAPPSRACSTSAHVSRRAAGSRPCVSSSRNTRRGRLTSASARNSRCRCPPLSVPNACRSIPSRPHTEASARQSTTSPASPANSCSASPTRSRSGSADVCSCAPISPRSSDRERGRVEPQHPHRPGVRGAQPLHHLDRRRLARTVAPGDPEDLALGDAEAPRREAPAGRRSPCGGPRPRSLCRPCRRTLSAQDAEAHRPTGPTTTQPAGGAPGVTTPWS